MEGRESSETRDRKGLTDQFERAWSQALTAVSVAEDEAAKVLQRFAGMAGWGQDEVKRHAREFTDRLSSQRKELERNVEDNVKKTLARLKVPRREQLQELETRIDRLGQRLDAYLSDSRAPNAKRH